jgi:hypothetical protein
MPYVGDYLNVILLYIFLLQKKWGIDTESFSKHGRSVAQAMHHHIIG